MTKLEKFKIQCAKVTNIIEIDSIIREEEDELLDQWLMEGPPDGMEPSEMIEEIDEWYEEWLAVGEEILDARGIDWRTYYCEKGE